METQLPALFFLGVTVHFECTETDNELAETICPAGLGCSNQQISWGKHCL